MLHTSEEHLTVLETLPFHHRDPFDRLLIATAIADDLILLTDDAQLQVYTGEKLAIKS